MNGPAQVRDPRNAAATRYRRGTLLAVAILIVSLCTALWGWRAMRRQAFERARLRFQQEVDYTSSSIISRLELYEDRLYATRSLFEANPNVTRTMFRDFVSNLSLEDRYPGIQGIGYAILLSPEEVPAHIRSVRSEGFPNYKIYPDSDRPEYTSIVFLEPFDWRNQRAFGYDMYSDPARRKAMEYARDNSTTGLTAKVRLVQETKTDVQPGFLMYLPLYRKGAPVGTVQQRRAALIGYVYSPFRARMFMKELTREQRPLTQFALYAAPAADQHETLYETSGFSAFKSPRLVSLNTFEFGGQVWTLRFLSSPQFDLIVSEGINPFFLPAGIAISFLLFGITISIARTEKRALRVADEITIRLQESEKRILQMNEQLTEALYRSEKLAITGRLVATVAHEINNPLEALTNILFLLKTASPGSADWNSLVQQAEDQVAVLTNVSRQTLAPHRFAPFPVATNISELLDDVLSAFRQRLTSANIQVQRKYAPAIEVTIYASELRQVFTNLIANAIDAMSPGGCLSVTGADTNGTVSISISDNGSGINPARLQRIFEPFYTTKGEKGTGVGLWVVKTIVEKLGGKIDVNSSTDPENHGTTVKVVVPNGNHTERSSEYRDAASGF